MSYICNKLLIRPTNPHFCLGERLGCLHNTLRLQFSKNMFKYSFKSFSSQHLLTKLFQLERKKKWEGQGLFPLSVSLIKCRVTCSKGIYGGSDAGTPKLLSKRRKISFSLMWANDRGSLAPSETFRWRQDWRSKEVSLGWHQRKALPKSGRAAKTLFGDILKDGAPAHTQRDGYAGKWGSHPSEAGVG